MYVSPLSLSVPLPHTHTSISDLPFTGILVSQAAFTFIYRFMANKSAEAPEGILNRQVLKSFMSIQGEGESMRWVPGHERFPENWYKRNQADEYGGVYCKPYFLWFLLCDRC